MKKPKKTVFNWSGGKDSALALYKILQSEEYEIVSLLTTLNSESRRSSMHGIPVFLLQKQADSIGLPLHIVEIPSSGEIGAYQRVMAETAQYFRKSGVECFGFGDIFLHDVRSYREKQLAPYGIEVVEPLWDKSSDEIMEEFLESGLKTVIVTTMADMLDETYIGRVVDRSLLADMPAHIDVCGENGEYHTFCYAGGMFRYPVEFSTGHPLFRSYPVRMDDGTEKIFTYWFADLQG